MAKRRTSRRSTRRRTDPSHVQEAAVELPEAPTAPTEPLPSVSPLFYLAIFLSAFLLFQVQPMISKAILPWFGGSPALWTASMLFFQMLLLAGYALAHFANKLLSAKWQVGSYLAVALLACLSLPILPDVAWRPAGDEDPLWRVLGVLASTIGMPFLLLSANATLLQVWYHRTTRRSPYALYALSNAGSLLGLLTYPSLVEPLLGLEIQAAIWSIAFVIAGVLIIGCGYLSCGAPVAPSAEADSDQPARLTTNDYAIWLGLSACGSVLLLAMTNHISQNVAVVPFLWVMPLALYLLTFIFAFASRPIYHRGAVGVVVAVTFTCCAFFYNSDGGDSVALMLLIHLVAMFAGCMLCHGELARRKPVPASMTVFYLTLSAGGALGGVLVNLVAPAIFFQYFEYPLVLIACWLILLLVAFRSQQSRLKGGQPLWAWGMITLVLFLFLFQIRDGVIRTAANSIISRRDFYGVLSVRAGRSHDGANWVELAHGEIVHGAQYVEEDRRFEPTTYYVAESGLGVAMQYVAGRPAKRIGVLGMGVATIAVYAERGDTFRCYEIDPNVVEIATNPKMFSFWSLFGSRDAHAETVIGDARLSLEKEHQAGQEGDFDVLVLDVFTGDAVPVHLLTVEAFQSYFEQLANDGILAVNISNRFLDLLPVVLGAALACEREIGIVIDPDRSEWLLLANATTFADLRTEYEQQVVPVRPTDRSVKWTDDYSNLFQVLK